MCEIELQITMVNFLFDQCYIYGLALSAATAHWQWHGLRHSSLSALAPTA